MYFRLFSDIEQLFPAVNLLVFYSMKEISAWQLLFTDINNLWIYSYLLNQIQIHILTEILFWSKF